MVSLHLGLVLDSAELLRLWQARPGNAGPGS